MKEQAYEHLQDLNLKNIHRKIQDLRLQLRNNTEQQFEYIRKKILNHHGQQSEQSQDKLSAYPLNIVETHPIDKQVNSNPHILLQSFSDKNKGNVFQQEDQQEFPQPTYFKDIKLRDDIDFERIKILSIKKISAYQASEYFKYTLSSQIEDKIKEIWESLIDNESKVNLRVFYSRISKMGIRFTEAIAIEIPIIKKNITLKKLLFEIAFKIKRSTLNWQEMKQVMRDYLPQSDPTIDQLMSKIKKQKIPIQSNHFCLPSDLINELKTIFRKNYVQKFISYCSITNLVNKIHGLISIQKYMNHVVRPKSNYDAGTTFKDTLEYIKRKAPHFVDLDQFLLYFSVHPYAYYPIQERYCIDQQSTLKFPPHHKHQVNRIKSAREINIQNSHRPRQLGLNQYMLSKNNPYSIRNRRLQQDLSEKVDDQDVIIQKFKARPYSKSLSEQKYQKFLASLETKKIKNRIKQKDQHIKSQHQIQRLKRQTKLFKMPQYEKKYVQKFSFTAREVPQVCISPRLVQIQINKQERRNKILSQTKFKYFNSWHELPHVATLQKQSPPKQSFSPPHIEIHQIPDYKLQHQRMKYELQVRKLRNKTTQPQQFHFRTEERHPFKYKAKVEQRHIKPNYDYKKIIYSPEPQIYYTQKFNDMIDANKQKAYQQSLSKIKKMQQDKQRKNKHANFAKFMKNPLSKLPNTAKICQLQAKAKIQRHKKHWKNLDRQYQDQLNEIYSKAIKRPFLYEIQTVKSSQYLLGAVSPRNKRAKKNKKEKKTIQDIQTNRSL